MPDDGRDVGPGNPPHRGGTGSPPGGSRHTARQATAANPIPSALNRRDTAPRKLGLSSRRKNRIGAQGNRT